MEVFERDDFQCQMCKNFFSSFQLSPHHLKSRKDGGTNRMGNLITMCNPCHNIAEINKFSKREILTHKEQPITDRKPIANDNDWHKWVYGGQRKPN